MTVKERNIDYKLVIRIFIYVHIGGFDGASYVVYIVPDVSAISINKSIEIIVYIPDM